MVNLSSDFEQQLEGAILDDVEQQARDEIGPRLKRVAQENWQAYASRHDYDISHIWQDATLAVDRDDDSVSVRIDWPALTALFEWGVDPHSIKGRPCYIFIMIGSASGSRPTKSTGARRRAASRNHGRSVTRWMK